MSSYIQQLFAERLGGSRFGQDNEIYKFEKIKRAKAAARRDHPDRDIIDFGVGESDEMAPPEVREVMKAEVDRWENRGYTDNGTAELKAAAAGYMNTIFGVSGLDPERHIQPTIGSKCALAMIPLVFINPGDIALMTVPGYPVLGTYTKYLGGDTYALPLSEENDFLPDLSAVPDDIAKKAKLLYLNYPNNPTGKGADRDFFTRAIEFARAHNVVIIQDAAYSRLNFTGKYLSILDVPGGMDTALELHSFSKMYNMTGWRLAFAVGNELAIAGLGDVKDSTDSGQFGAIINAGIHALNHPELSEPIIRRISRRHDKMVALLSKFGFQARKPDGTFYLYVRCPRGVKGGPAFASAEEFSQWLITEKSISTVPWDDVGAFVRFSATFVAEDEPAEDRILAEVESRLRGVTFEFHHG
jgi:LL-diaminopimelate aminotransferase